MSRFLLLLRKSINQSIFGAPEQARCNSDQEKFPLEFSDILYMHNLDSILTHNFDGIIIVAKNPGSIILAHNFKDINIGSILMTSSWCGPPVVIFTDLLSKLLDGTRPAQAVWLGSVLACHQRASLWSTISRMSPRLKLTPASAQGIAGSSRGQ